MDFPDLSYRAHQQRVLEKLPRSIERGSRHPTEKKKEERKEKRKYALELESLRDLAGEEALEAELEAMEVAYSAPRAPAPWPKRPSPRSLPPIPSGRSLELFVPGPLNPEPGILSHAVHHFDAINSAMLNLQDELETTLRGEPQRVDPRCRSWRRNRGPRYFRLRACLTPGPHVSYEYALEIGGDVAGAVTFEDAVTGRGSLGPGANQGSVRFRLGIIDDGSGTLAYAYDLRRTSRELRVELIGFAARRDSPRISTTHRYRMNDATGGRAELSLLADLIGSQGSQAWWGEDGKRDPTSFTIAWDRAGAGKGAAKICAPGSENGPCVALRQCWTQNGSVGFFGFGNAADADLGWSETDCPNMRVLEPPMPFEPKEEDAMFSYAATSSPTSAATSGLR